MTEPSHTPDGGDRMSENVRLQAIDRVWLCFAENGNIRFWTADHNRAEYARIVEGLDLQVFEPEAKSLAPYREAIARIIHPVGFEEDSMELVSVVEAHRKDALRKADKIIAALNEPAHWLPEAGKPITEAPASGWRPIGTAPKDGTRILLWQSVERGVFTGWWYNGWPRGEAYWMDAADSEPEPTHWMPLPDAPAPPEGGG